MRIRFEELLDKVGAGGVEVLCDSRGVGAGDVFAAIRGVSFDGHDFIDAAVKRGAKYIVSQEDIEFDGVLTAVVADSGKAYGQLCQARWEWPGREMVNLAVTGTNGKTTVCYMVREVINSAGCNAGLIGTVICDDGKSEKPADMTTPDANSIARLGREMASNGVTHMVIEASSHGICQGRLSGIDFLGAGFTNLTGDHLDYHKTMEEYFCAKSGLFEQLGEGATAVLNKGSVWSQKLAEITRAKVLWYGIDEGQLRAEIISMDGAGTQFDLCYCGEKVRVRSGLIGRHNVSNHLTAAGLCLSAGFSLGEIGEGLSRLSAVPGRCERVETERGFEVLVDYAHTDDAMRNVLSTLREVCERRLIVVFGCGGNRDKTKRARMAAAAEELADIVIVTSDNPRGEDASAIMDDIRAGFSDADAVSFYIDRKEAIAASIARAGKGDIVLIAGKGHEDYQIIGDERIHFSDVETVREVLGVCE